MITYHGTSEDIKVLTPPSYDNIFYVAAKPEYAAYHSFGKNRNRIEGHPQYAGYVYLVELDANNAEIADFKTKPNADVLDALSNHNEYDTFYIPQKMLSKCIETNEWHLIGIAHAFLDLAFWWKRGYNGKNSIISPLRQLLKYYEITEDEYDGIDALIKAFIEENGTKALSNADMKNIEIVKFSLCLKLWQAGYRAYKDFEQIGIAYSGQRKQNIKSEIFGIFGWGVIQSISKNPLPKKFVVDYLTSTYVKSKKDANMLIKKFQQSDANMEKMPYYSHDLELQEQRKI